MTTLTLDPALEARLAVVASQEGRDIPGTATAILDLWLREREQEIEELRAMIDASDAEGGELSDDDIGRTLAHEHDVFVATRAAAA